MQKRKVYNEYFTMFINFNETSLKSMLKGCIGLHFLKK